MKPGQPNEARPAPAPKKPLSPAAERALAEAAARRAERDRIAAGQPQELRGRGGLDPEAVLFLYRTLYLGLLLHRGSGLEGPDPEAWAALIERVVAGLGRPADVI